MSVVGKLIGFGFRQVIGAVAGDEAGEMAANVAGPVVQLVERHLADHSQTLPNALTRANDRTWQALIIALAGDGFLDQVNVFFAAGDDKGIREQVRIFLQGRNIAFEGTSADFRKRCLAELKAARELGRLSANGLSSNEIARHTSGFKRYSDLKGLVDGAQQVVSQMANGLVAEFPNLGRLLMQNPGDGPPMVVAAFAYFLRREVETDPELAHGLFFDGLRQLSASQAKAFDGVGRALNSLGDQFEEVFEQLGRIETVVVETHGAVLDMQTELQRLGSLHLDNADELRRLLQEVLSRVSQAGMQKGEVKSHHSFSVRSDDERTAIKQLLERFRQLPAQQQKQVPALLNGLGKLQFGSQDFEGARQTFTTVAKNTTHANAQAEAQFNAYRAALEEKKWADALDAIQQAANLDSQRFAPFPLQRYQPSRILGAGGFGTAFLCHDRNFEEEVVVKTLHEGVMERSMTDVFREARLLRKLNHSAIIGVHECEYADPLKQVRPYIVMDYFPGSSLQAFVHDRGTIPPDAMIGVARQIAEGIQVAHQNNILHRDLKPDNVLIRKEDDSWSVKIIDFGLALRKQTIETSVAEGGAENTILGDSVAGTIEYAPPEQMGKLKGVKPGPYSDVYSFGKMCCYALFKTTEPRSRHWAAVPKKLHEMLEQCTEQELTDRLPSFEPVLKALQTLASQQQEQDAQRAELERKRREQEEAQRKEQEQRETGTGQKVEVTGQTQGEDDDGTTAEDGPEVYSTTNYVGPGIWIIRFQSGKTVEVPCDIRQMRKDQRNARIRVWVANIPLQDEQKAKIVNALKQPGAKFTDALGNKVPYEFHWETENVVFNIKVRQDALQQRPDLPAGQDDDLEGSGVGTGATQTSTVQITPIHDEEIRENKKSYVLWLKPPIIQGNGRFCHFSWEDTSFRVRDYIGREQLYYPTASERRGFARMTPCKFTRDSIWFSAAIGIPCEGPLYHAVSDFAWWQKKLTEMTQNPENCEFEARWFKSEHVP